METDKERIDYLRNNLIPNNHKFFVRHVLSHFYLDEINALRKALLDLYLFFIIIRVFAVFTEYCDLFFVVVLFVCIFLDYSKI